MPEVSPRNTRFVGIAEPDVLVVKRAHARADKDRPAQDRHADDPDHPADRGALADAAGAHLLLLELAVLIEDQVPMVSLWAMPESFNATAAESGLRAHPGRWRARVAVLPRRRPLPVGCERA